MKAIREQIKNGVDHIKLSLSGGIMGPAWDLHTHSFLLDDEIRAAFEICHSVASRSWRTPPTRKQPKLAWKSAGLFFVTLSSRRP